METFLVKTTLGLEKHKQIVGVFSLEVYFYFFKNLIKSNKVSVHTPGYCESFETSYKKKLQLEKK